MARSPQFWEFRKPPHAFVFGGRETTLTGNFGNIWKKGAEMKRLCDLFNQYRDGMLDSEQKTQFESHLAACEKCMPRLFLLNNMVHAIRNQNIPDPTDRPERIADRAYDADRVLGYSLIVLAETFAGMVRFGCVADLFRVSLGGAICRTADSPAPIMSTCWLRAISAGALLRI